METVCLFKNTEAVEKFCENGAKTCFNPRNLSHFIAVEGHLYDEPFKHGTRFLVGFPQRLWKGEAKTNSVAVLQNLSRIFPEMECDCWKRKARNENIIMRKKNRSYSSWELSCPHFGIRAVSYEQLKNLA